MSTEHFVGRSDALKRLNAVLTGGDVARGNLTIQSVEGPGGIGKTFLFDHAVGGLDHTTRNYPTLRIDGNDASARTLVRAVSRMVKSADAEAIRDKASGYYFPAVDRVIKAIETIRSEAVAEFQKHHPDNKEGRLALLRFLDLAFEAGKRINDAFPITKKHVNVHELQRARRLLEEMIPLMSSLREEAGRFFELFGAFSPAGITVSDIEDVRYTLQSGETIKLQSVSQPTEADSTTYQTVWQLTDEPDAALDTDKTDALLAALASYVTGQELHVNGGMYMA